MKGRGDGKGKAEFGEERVGVERDSGTMLTYMELFGVRLFSECVLSSALKNSSVLTNDVLAVGVPSLGGAGLVSLSMWGIVVLCSGDPPAAVGVLEQLRLGFANRLSTIEDTLLESGACLGRIMRPTEAACSNVLLYLWMNS